MKKKGIYVSNGICHVFSVFNGLKWKDVVRFIDIAGIPKDHRISLFSHP